MMNRLALILALILTSSPAWSAAPILETDGPANANITTEVSIGSYTASANTMVYAQAVCLSGLTATAANIQYRLLQTTAADAGIANIDIVAKAKYATANTYYGSRLLGPVLLLSGQKAVLYALSSNAGDTVVSCQVDWIDALALPTGAAATTTVMEADVTKIHGSALTETSSGYLAAGVTKMFDVATPLMTVVAQVPTAAQNGAASWEIQTTEGGAAGTYGAFIEALPTIQRGEPPALTGIALTTDVTTSQGVVTAAITSATSTIGGYITAAQGVITGAITTSQGIITTAITSATSTIGGYVTSATSTITAAITSATSTIGGYITAAQGVITAAITAAQGVIVGHIADIGVDVFNTPTSSTTTAGTWGKFFNDYFN